MKKSKRRILFIAGGFVLIILTIILVQLSPLLSMKPAETGRIANSEIIAVKNNINSLYFIELEEGYALIDAGSNIKTIEKSLTDLSIPPESVKYILLTHSDSDHVAALSLFPQAKIYMSADELQMIDGTTKRGRNQSNALPEGIAQNSLILLDGEEELTIGNYTVRCIKIPGHTPGSMAYLFADNYLFTGDAVRVQNKTLGVHPFSMDADLSQQSIQKLKEIIGDSNLLVLTAHYGYYNADKLILG